MKNFNQLTAIALLIATCGSIGCQTFRDGEKVAMAKPKLIEKLDVPNGIPWKAKKPPKPGIPERIVATWTDTVLQKPSNGMQPASAERGFGGRLFFHNNREAKPIAVEGQLVIYAFDETDRKLTDNQPTRRYVFPADQFAKHQSESEEFGISYSVWLPWDKVGGDQTEVSLIARFEPLRGGNLLVSEQAKQRLPGKLTMPAIEQAIVKKEKITAKVEQVSHTAAISPQASAPAITAKQETGGLQTTTITLPQRSRFGAGGAAKSSGLRTNVTYSPPGPRR